MAFVVYPQSIILFSISFHYRLLLSPHFGDIFSSFLNAKNSQRYRQLLWILSNIYHATLQITSSVVACYCFGLFSPTRSFTFIYILKLLIVYVLGMNRKSLFSTEKNRQQTISLNFFPLFFCAKLNGNYFSLTLQGWKKIP